VPEINVIEAFGGETFAQGPQDVDGSPHALVERPMQSNEIGFQHLANREAAGQHHEMINVCHVPKGRIDRIGAGHVRTQPTGQTVFGGDLGRARWVRSEHGHLGAGRFGLDRGREADAGRTAHDQDLLALDLAGWELVCHLSNSFRHTLECSELRFTGTGLD
jgi:hypothetical protein